MLVLREAQAISTRLLGNGLHPLDRLQRAGWSSLSAISPAFDPSGSVLVLSPHLDDAVLSCWAVLGHTGAPVVVVNVFAGIPPPGFVVLADALAGATDSCQRMHERRTEDAVCLGSIGRHAINLPYLSHIYRGLPPRLRDAARAIVQHTSTASRIVAPAAIGGHPDHVFTRELGRLMGSLTIPVELYADLPYAVAFAWPHWVTGMERSKYLDIDRQWRIGGRDSARLSREGAIIERLSRSEQQRKLAVMRRYETQYPTLTSGGRDMLADPNILGFEVRWPDDVGLR
jgi:LmbE family N-acetylglucosaminyl deacetylase